LVDQTERREDDWFRQNEKKMLEDARTARLKREKERAAQEAEEARRRLKEAHFMKCPKCGHDMKSETLDSIEIDRCSFCEGVYFDAGELDQLFLTKKASERQGILKRILGI
jgi:RNA polymerase-binding transcription factor DksA